jgi:alpha-galactosidase
MMELGSYFLFLQEQIKDILIQSCARGGRRIVEEMCYEIRRAEAWGAGGLDPLNYYSFHHIYSDYGAYCSSHFRISYH